MPALRSIAWLALLTIAASPGALAGDMETLELEPTQEIYRARVHFAEPAKSSPRAVLVLCPGQNVDGASHLANPVWRELAREHDLQLAAIYFYSPDEVLRDSRGYFRAERESAAMLNEALERRGLETVPLLLYGFSGGAFFVNNYAQSHPGKVEAWSAMAVSKWERAELPEDPARHEAWLATPAVLACGELDEPRYGATKLWFQTHRRLGAPWAWVSLGDHPHRYHRDFEEFTAKFFAHVLEPPETPVLADITTESAAEPGEGLSTNQLETWLPDPSLLSHWRGLHTP